MTTTMMHGATFDGSANSEHSEGRRPATWSSASLAPTLEDMAHASTSASASRPMMYIVTGAQTHRGRPDPIIGAGVVSAALWCMFAAAVCNTIVF